MMKNAHLTTIFEHNRNRQTDQLYEPLRQAISRNSSNKRTVRDLSPHPPFTELKNSKISKKLRVISSQQAEEMQNNIFIPSSRKLVPTKDKQILEGKKFAAVDIQVQYNEPISQQEFQQQFGKKEPTYMETVYSVSSTPTPRPISGFQSPKQQKEDVYYQSSSQYQLFKKQTPQLKTLTKQPETAPRQRVNSVEPERGMHKLNAFYSSPGKQSQATLEQWEKSSRRRTKAKSNYKYNLFSAFDESVNTKCATCWPENEIIAVKPSYDPWY